MKNNKKTNKRPNVMKHIWEKTKREMAEEREIAVGEVDTYHRYQVQQDGVTVWDHEIVAASLARMHEALIEWVGLMDEEIYILLYLSTIAKACLVRVNKQTGEYDSALILLSWADEYAVLIDTDDKSIMAGTDKRLVLRLDLPYAEYLQSKIKRYYDIARSVRQLEAMTASNGERTEVLFANV